MATCRLSVVLMKPKSTPPHTLNSLGCQKAVGSRPIDTPRYTLVALVSLPSLTTAELTVQCARGSNQMPVSRTGTAGPVKS
jgi:hypothetical protein